MKIVIRLGGSVVASPPNIRLLKEYAEIIQKLKGEGHEMVIVVGGGSTAREFINLAQKLDLPEKEQDEIAISISRIFAQLLALKIDEKTVKIIPTSVEGAAQALFRNKAIVMGGLKPGMTTDSVAALVASKINADLIVKATDQEGVYTEDPKTHPEAKKIDEMNFDELESLWTDKKHRAGIHRIIDPKAVQILKENKIKTIVLNGSKPKNLKSAIEGEKIGTKIQ
jgi:uridylate kinase